MNEEKLKYIYWFAYFNFESPSVRYRAKFPLDCMKMKYDIDYTLIIPRYNFVSIFKLIETFLSIVFLGRRIL